MTQGRISQLTANGGPLAEAVTEDNRIQLSKALELNKLRQDAIKTGQSSELLKEDLDWKKARADAAQEDALEKKYRRLQREGVLLDADAAYQETFDLLRGLRDQLLGVGAKLVSDLVGMTGAREIKALITSEIERRLAETTDSLQERRGTEIDA